MDTPKIISNYHWHPILDAEQLTAKQRADIAYTDDCAPVFLYRGRAYAIDELYTTSFHHAPAWIREWDGYASDSYFSGIVVKFSGDRDAVQIGIYLS